MDLLKDHIVMIPKSQSRFGNLQFLFAFVSWAGVIGSLKEYYSKDKGNFNCNATADSNLINQLCYSLYTEEYNSPLPQFTFAIINGCVTIGIWITFALYLGPRLLFFKRQVNMTRALGGPLQLRERQDQDDKCISIYGCYLLQIFIRVAFSITMVALLLSFETFEVHERFDCRLAKDDDNVVITTVCLDAYFAHKTHTNIAMLVLNTIMILLAIAEAIFLLAGFGWHGGLATHPENVNLLEADTFPRQLNCFGFLFPSDAEFIYYLLRETLQEELNEMVLNVGQISDDFKETVIEKTKDLFTAVPLPLPFASLNTDKLYTTVVLRSEERNRRGSVNSSARELTLGEILSKETENSLEKTRSILLYGCAGVGKSMLCQKLLREWATDELSASCDKLRRIKFVFLLKCRELNYITRNISLGRLLNCSRFSPIDDETCQRIAKSMPSSMLIIFDGIDEFHNLSSCAGDLFNYGDDTGAEMPVSAWYAKLEAGRILRGCTVITTSRINLVATFPRQLEFDKVVKHCGMTVEKAKELIVKLMGSESHAKDHVLDLVKSDPEIESLVCIPENCIIICCYFLHKIRDAIGNNDKSPTLSEIYDGLLHHLIVLRNPGCIAGNIPNCSSPHAVLVKLFALAYTSMKLGKSLLSRRDLEEFALPEGGVEPLINSGLLQCLPFAQTGPACFETQFCFSSMMQEFLTAKYLVGTIFDSRKEFESVIKESVAMNKKWDIVIHFVACLLKGDEVKMRYFIRALRKTISNFDVRTGGQQLLLAARCCFEYKDDLITSQELAADLQGCIDLSSCQMNAFDNRVILYLLSCCCKGSIDTLRIFNNSFGRHECEELARLMVSGHGPTEELDLSYDSVGDDGVGILSQGLRSYPCSLEHLTLSGNNIDGRGIGCLLDALKESHCKLKTLNLAYNNFNDANAIQLSGILADGSLPLISLSLAGCGINDTATECLTTALININCHVQYLDLSDSALTEYGIALLARALRQQECYVQSLRLRDNDLTDESVRVICESLANPFCRLQSLDVASTAITDIGAKHIARALQSGYCNLRLLNLSRNSFGHDGCAHIAEATASCRCPLEELMLNQNGISDKEALLFEDCFKSPKYNKLSSLYLCGNSVSDKCKSDLLCAFLDAKAIYWKQIRGRVCF